MNILSLIHMLNIIDENPESFPYKGDIHPLKRYVFNYVYFPMIDEFEYLPEKYLTNELKKVRDDVRQENNKFLELIDNLTLSPLTKENMPYYSIISTEYKHLGPKSRGLIDSLFELKLEESRKLVQEYSVKLELSLRINYLMNFFGGEAPFKRVKDLSWKDYMCSLEVIEKASLIEKFNQYKQI